MNLIFRLYIFIGFLLVMSCMHSYSYEDIINFMQEPRNGLIKEKSINNVNVKLVFKPYQLLAWQELQSLDSVSKERKRELFDKYGNHYYFLLAISTENMEILNSASDRIWFNQMLNQLVFNMADKVTLTTESNDTLHMVDYSYPRLFGLDSSTDIIFAFEKLDIKKQKITFKLEEFGLHTGDINFVFNSKDIIKSSRYRID